MSLCYFPKEAEIVSTELHGFSDASESAYAGVVYLRMLDSKGRVHTSLVASKTKVAPKLLHHVRSTLYIPVDDVYSWTDSTIVLNWLDGSLPNLHRESHFVHT